MNLATLSKSESNMPVQSAAKACEVCWLPAHPFDGSVSMNRYWRSLSVAAEELDDPHFAITCPLGTPPLESPSTTRWKRAFHRYLVYPRIVRQVTTPMVHILDHSSLRLMKFLRKETRVVVTVHDLEPLINPHELSPPQRKRFAAAVQNMVDADAVIAVSDYTRSQIEHFFPAVTDRVRVVYNGVSQHFSHPANSAHVEQLVGANRRYFLSLGGTAERKNLGILPAVFSEMRARGHDVWLVRAGEKLPPQLASGIRSAMGHDRLLELGRITDHDLSALYQHAEAVMIPSTVEGFGLPVLEAMVANCPVACSRASSLIEVGGEAVAFFDPHDPVSMSDVLERLWLDESFRAACRDKGRVHVQRFSWKQHVRCLLDIYQELSA